MRIAVCGGTGVVGRHVVRVAAARGHEVAVLSRAEGVDLARGPEDAVDAALAGADAVVDVLSTSTLSAKGAVAFFTATTRRLLAAEQLTRPVAAAEVADHLVAVAEGGPVGRAPDLVGPADDTLAAMIRRLSAHEGTRRRVLEVRLPGRYGAGLASGALRGGPDAVRGRLSFDDWLGSTVRAG